MARWLPIITVLVTTGSIVAGAWFVVFLLF